MNDPIPLQRALREVIDVPAVREVELLDPDNTEHAAIIERRKVAQALEELGRAEIEDGRPGALTDDSLLVGARFAAAQLVRRLVAGEFPIRSGREAAQVMKALHEIARLEAGQATSISSEVSAEDVLKQMDSFASRVKERLAATGKVIEVDGE